MQIRTLIKSYLLFALVALGISLGIKAGLGLSSFNAFSMSLGQMMTLKVGHVVVVLNLTFLGVYIVQTHFNDWVKYGLQVLSVLIFGSLVNYFTYDMLEGLDLTGYASRVIVFLMGTLISGLSIGGLIYYDQITFPLENVCRCLADRLKVPFVYTRYGFDVIFLLLACLMALTQSSELNIREGTLMSMVVLPGAIDLGRRLLFRIDGHQIMGGSYEV